MERREFLKIFAIATGGAVIGGGTCGAIVEGVNLLTNGLNNQNRGNFRPLEFGDVPTRTATATPKSEVTPTITKTPKPTETSNPDSKFDKLGPGKLVIDSVWPGGIETDPNSFSLEEAQIVTDIYNGATLRTEKQGNKEKLAAARAYAENIFELKGVIDAGTLTKQSNGPEKITVGKVTFETTSDVFYTAAGNDEKDGSELKFSLLEVKAPKGFTFNQIAVSDTNTGHAYVNNGSTISGEKIYVVIQYDKDLNSQNTLMFRGACGNIGRGEKALPQPTKGATNQPRPTPTGGFENPTQTPFNPTNTPSSPTETPKVPTKVPTVTQGATQPVQPTRTPGGSGATPIVNTPLPTNKPTEQVQPTNQPVEATNTPSF